MIMMLNCKDCVGEIIAKHPGTRGQSPRSYARLEVGLLEDKQTIRVSCVRHDKVVADLALAEGLFVSCVCCEDGDHKPEAIQ